MICERIVFAVFDTRDTLLAGKAPSVHELAADSFLGAGYRKSGREDACDYLKPQHGPRRESFHARFQFIVSLRGHSKMMSVL